MADFVAVIRRAVDGLANNTPEMRIRVYEKARGAVQRQLENMKPRPTDDMLRRQMEKLEAAIREVEAEHAEALPALDEPAPAALAFPAQPQTAVEPEPQHEPVYAAPAPSAHVDPVAAPDAEPQRDFAPAEQDAYDSAPQHVEPTAHDAPVNDAREETSAAGYDRAYADEAETAPVRPEPEAPVSQAVFGEARHEEPVWAAPVRVEPVRVEPEEPSYSPAYADASEAVSVDYAPPAEVAEEPSRGFEPEHDDLAPAPAQFSGPNGRDTPFGQPVSAVSGDPFADDEPAYAPFARADASRMPEPPLAMPERPEPVYPVYDGPQRPRSLATPVWPDAPSTAPSIAEEPLGSDEPEVAATSHAEALPADHAWHASAHQDLPAHDAGADDHAQSAATSHWPEDTSWKQDQSWESVTAASVETPARAAGLDDREAAELFEAHFDEPARAEAHVEMPAVTGFPDFPATAATKARSAAEPEPHDPLATYLQPLNAQAKAKVEPKPAAPAAAAAGDPWNDLEQLIGYDRDGEAKAARAADGPPDEEDLAGMTMPTRPYRVQPKPKRSYGKILLAVVGLCLVAGGGFAVWKNRTTLDELVENVTGGAIQPPVEPAKTPAATQGATTAAAPAAGNGATPAPANAPAASANAGPTKFTQRLLANGTEVDTGPGGPSVGAPGQSIAQASPPAAGADAPAAGATAQSAPANPAAPAAPAAGTPPAATPAAAGEKIFLYEEKIGQSSLTSIAGTVTWSLQNETGDDGKPQPVVQGRISVPERGMTALLTFKRNTDPSLPASHLVEFVFSLPPNFEGGSIESVQRISMKQSEQDRGDPLVAVPAKITPDFHMIALNDFPDARARNMDLLKSRNWLDVPIIYGTGRRALLTLQKGPEGIKAFDEAIRGWAALSPPQGQ
ncbi:hypothetical protein [Rhizobium straminoryzae]|uniref:Uncharacterized protein n=1 Tax=Rhizobium straminoryzae TaxID=1387186 RepID=A0A549T1Z6_9HYPH|nr:hypothetical protein [Rhizobium straminoryzae]TRL35893.1 hypothetical protein FNA46_18705 [Rhizobium straminoryzae]